MSSYSILLSRFTSGAAAAKCKLRNPSCCVRATSSQLSQLTGYTNFIGIASLGHIESVGSAVPTNSSTLYKLNNNLNAPFQRHAVAHFSSLSTIDESKSNEDHEISVDAATEEMHGDANLGGWQMNTDSSSELMYYDNEATALPDTEDTVASTDSNKEPWHDSTSETSLSDLLKADIFGQSWLEAESKSKPESNSYTPSTNDEKQINSPIANPSSPIEMRYNEILQQSNSLLEALSDDGEGSNTLQLNDFDAVMVQWSQFHSEVDESSSLRSNQSQEIDYDDAPVKRPNLLTTKLKCKASENCMLLLNALEENYDAIYDSLSTDASAAPKHSKLFPNAASYNLALHALAHSYKGQGIASEAYLLLNRMMDRCRRYLELMESGEETRLPPPPPEPTIITYNSAIHAIARSGASEAGFLSEEVFTRMEGWKQECEEREIGNKKYQGALPNARTLASLLSAWANTKTVHGQSLVPERTTAILDMALERRREYVRSVKGECLDEYHSFDEKDFEGITEENLDDEFVREVMEETVNDELYNDTAPSSSMTDACSQSADHSTTDAQPFLRPNIVAFNTVLHAWSMSKRGREGALRAHELLDKVERLSESGKLDLPDGYDDPTVYPVDVDDNSLDTGSSLKPNVKSYSTVMNAWANVSHYDREHGENAASKCELILHKMEERGAEDALVRPNLASYTTCISAWARTYNVEHAASRAENILNRMIDLYYDEGAIELPSLKGDLENAQHDAPFNAVITAYARSTDPNAPDRAFAILDRLEASPIEPTATTYNAVLDACAKHGEPDRALSILERMKAKSIVPDPTSYDTILNAFARDQRDGSAQRAWELLQKLEEERMNGQSDFIPTNYSYSTVINAFARASGRGDGGIHIAEQAKEVYDKMIHLVDTGKLAGKLDTFANSCLLNCCANVKGPSSESRAALIMAINIFEEMKRNTRLHGEPNQYTFGTMMKASIRLSSDESEKIRLLESLFAQACARGYLSGSVLGQFIRNMPSNLSGRAILSQGGFKRDLPEKWYRKLQRKDWPTAMGDRDKRSERFIR